MIRKIFKTGHSLAVTVSKQFLDELGLKIGDSVKIEFDKDRGQLSLRPGNKEKQLALEIHSKPKLGARPTNY